MSDNTLEDFAWAVKTGDLANVKKAIESGKVSANVVESGATNARTPMHMAADYGQGMEISELSMAVCDLMLRS